MVFDAGWAQNGAHSFEVHPCTETDLVCQY
jgi:hypothetical protein